VQISLDLRFGLLLNELLMTLPPYLDSPASALSVVICSTTMKSADVPGFSMSRT
jgi:hypothetical protein